VVIAIIFGATASTKRRADSYAPAFVNVPRVEVTVADVLVLLTEREAEEIAQALQSRLEGLAGYRGPGYHLHVEDNEGSELTIGVLDRE
jgi:hypothetical protein